MGSLMGKENLACAPPPFFPAVHFVGFRGEEYWSAVKVWGRPGFVHRWWDRRAFRDVAPEDTVVFAQGGWTQEPMERNAPDIDE